MWIFILHTIRARLETQETCEWCIYWIRKPNPPNELWLLAHRVEPNFSRAELPSDLLCCLLVTADSIVVTKIDKTLYTCHSESISGPSPQRGRVQTDISIAWKDSAPSFISMRRLCWCSIRQPQHTRTFPGTSLCNLNRVITPLTSQETEIKWRKNDSLLCYEPSSSRDGNLTESHDWFQFLNSWFFWFQAFNPDNCVPNHWLGLLVH